MSIQTIYTHTKIPIEYAATIYHACKFTLQIHDLFFSIFVKCEVCVRACMSMCNGGVEQGGITVL